MFLFDACNTWEARATLSLPPRSSSREINSARFISRQPNMPATIEANEFAYGAIRGWYSSLVFVIIMFVVLPMVHMFPLNRWHYPLLSGQGNAALTERA
jgi:hypothetical protein